MKKIIGVVVLAALVLTLIVPGAFAAVSDAQQKEIDSMNKQMAELQKKMIQKYLDAGLITQQQADYMQQNIEQRSQIQNQFPNQQYGNEYGYGYGYGCYGWGNMMNGYGGRGGWGCW